jgi:glycosyltransferase involved in cell wall biosynthesis
VITHVHTPYHNLNRRNRFIEKLLSHYTAAIICCSNAVKTFMSEHIGVDSHKLVTIYNGTDVGYTDGDSPVGPYPAKQLTSIAVIASLVENKGHRYLFEAVAALREGFKNIELLVAGEGPLRPWLEDTARKLKIDDCIKFLGLCEDIRPILRSSDICVLPSIEREGLGLALIEAMAFAKPVVAANIGGIPEVIEDGVNGYLVPPKDAGQLRERMARLIQDAALRVRMGNSGRSRYEEKFRADAMGRKVLDLYDRLLRGIDQTPLNVLYLHNKSEVRGGGEQSLINLWKHLDRNRFRPFLIVPGEGSLSRKARSMGLEVATVRVPKIRSRNIVAAASALKRLIKYCKDLNIDVIHSYTPRNNLLAALIGRFLHIRVVWHERNLIFGDEFDVSKWLSFLPHHIICNSNAIADRFTNHRRCGAKIDVILNGADLYDFKPGPAPDDLFRRFKPNGGKIVGLISGLSRRKMPEYFIKAGAEIVQAHPGVTLLVVGGETAEEDHGRRDGLQQFSRRLGIEKNIVFTGFVENVADMIRLFDVGVAVTEKEACSRAIIEMMASGIPVVAYKTGGNTELVEDRRTGILVGFGDIHGLADAVIGLLENETARKVLGVNARARAEKVFDIKRNVRMTEAVYNDR